MANYMAGVSAEMRSEKARAIAELQREQLSASAELQREQLSASAELRIEKQRTQQAKAQETTAKRKLFQERVQHRTKVTVNKRKLNDTLGQLHKQQDVTRQVKRALKEAVKDHANVVYHLRKENRSLREEKLTLLQVLARTESELRRVKETMGVFKAESFQLQRQLERDKEERWSEERQKLHQFITDLSRKFQKRIDNAKASWTVWAIKREKEKDRIKRLVYLHKLELSKRKLCDELQYFKARCKELEKKQDLKHLRAQLKQQSGAVEVLENRLSLHEEDADSAAKNALPAWVEHMTDRKTQQRPYPNEYVAASVDLMASANIAAEKMPNVMKKTFHLWHDKMQQPDDDVEFATGRTFARWRAGLPYLCLIQIGMLLSLHAKEMTIIQDGTPDDGQHIEAFTVHVADTTIKSFPWLQPDKKSETSANGFRDMVAMALTAYTRAWRACGDKTGLPDPKKPKDVLSAIGVMMSDNAPNEGKRQNIVAG